VWHGGVAQREGQVSSARGVCLCGPARAWGQTAQAEAHREHAAHGYDAGGVKAQRLVESIRTLPIESKRGHPTEGRRVCGTEVWHRGKGESAAHVACGVCGPAREWGQTAQAEAHIEHAAHGCDAGGVKAQRLVESIRTLPSPKGGIRQRDDACVARRCGTEGRAIQQRTRRAFVWPSSGVGADGAGGSAPRTFCSWL